MKTVTEILNDYFSDNGISIAHICRKLYGEVEGNKHSTQENLRKKLRNGSDVSMQLVIDISNAIGHNLLEVINKSSLIKKKKKSVYAMPEEVTMDMVMEEKFKHWLDARDKDILKGK